MRLDKAAAEKAIGSKVAQPLGLDVRAAAKAMIRVANANMADAVRLISLRRGYDPREFALVVFGGAGPLHGAELARELSIPTVVIPPSPGIWSALGCLQVDIRHDLSVMLLGSAAEVDPDEVERHFAELEAQGRELLQAEGVSEGGMALERSLDMRYLGQWRSLAVPVGSPVSSLEPAVAHFHTEHERVHNYRRDDAPVEIYRLNLRALGSVEKARLPRYTLDGSSPPAEHERRQVLFDQVDEAVDTPVYDRSRLSAGAEFEGPAVVEQLDSTTVVPPGVVAKVDEWLNIRMTLPSN
jgi:N-methylhydantoinase A